MTLSLNFLPSLVIYIVYSHSYNLYFYLLTFLKVSQLMINDSGRVNGVSFTITCAQDFEVWIGLITYWTHC